MRFVVGIALFLIGLALSIFGYYSLSAWNFCIGIGGMIFDHCPMPLYIATFVGFMLVLSSILIIVRSFDNVPKSNTKPKKSGVP